MRRNLEKLKKFLKRGDTIIEVTFAITVFSLVSVISIQIMDRDLANIQGTLELEMARNEIDAQAEALRYIQNSYLSERELAVESGATKPGELTRHFMNLWLKLSRGVVSTSGQAGTGLANKPADISQFTSMACSQYYSGTGDYHALFLDNAFVINTRNLNPEDVSGTIVQSTTNPSDHSTWDTKKFKESSLYPRVIFTKGTSGDNTDDAVLAEIFPDVGANPTKSAQQKPVYDSVDSAEGIWVISARQCKDNATCLNQVPEFYDFHIRTCWFAPGHDRPSTIATTIRLYNPEYIEAQR